MQTIPVKPDQTMQPVELVNSPEYQHNASPVQLPDGNSAADTLVAISVLVSAIAGLLKVLMPVILRLLNKKTKK